MIEIAGAAKSQYGAGEFTGHRKRNTEWDG